MKRICSKCGEDATGYAHGDSEMIVCVHCGFTEHNYQSGYDDGWVPASRRLKEDTDEDDEDEEFAPKEWWEDDE